MVSRNLEVYCDESSLENLFKDNKKWIYSNWWYMVR